MIIITPDAPLGPLNTMMINGTADYLVEWQTAEDIDRLLTDCAYTHIIKSGIKAIGQGSNLLFRDTHYKGTLLKCVASQLMLLKENTNSIELRVDAGHSLDELVAHCCRKNLWGIENLSLIPGTVGAAAVQNVGAYGAEFKNVVTAVNCYDITKHQTVRFEKDHIGYGYRQSMFKRHDTIGRYIIISVDIKLSKLPHPVLEYGNLAKTLSDNPDDINKIRETIIALRLGKLPEVGVIGSAGSFFKNPVVTEKEMTELIKKAQQAGIDCETIQSFKVDGKVKIPAAWLIDRAGWKGVNSHHAGVWPKQPLVLVNADGRATGADIAALADSIRHDIKDRFGIELETEVEYL